MGILKSPLPVHFLETREGSQGPLPWGEVIDQVINTLSANLDSPILLVLDDVHIVTAAGDMPHIIDRLIGLAPVQLHLLLSGRPVIILLNLSSWHSQGEVLLLDQSLLTFTTAEIEALIAMQYGLELSSDEVDALSTYTEGWAIALQLFWQSIRSQTPSTIEFPLRMQTNSLNALFDMLTHEVFEHQLVDVRDFLLVTSTLRELKPESCDALRKVAGYGVVDSATMLTYLWRQDLFVVETAGDVVETKDIISGDSIVSGIWTNAVEMGRIAGDNMAGGNSNYQGAFSLLNAMELGGLPVVSVGEVQALPGDGVEVFTERHGQTYRKLVFRGDRLIGLILVGNIERAGIYQILIREKADVSALRHELLGTRFHYGHYILSKPGVIDRYVVAG